MADVIDLNEKEFEKAAAAGEAGVLAILKYILQEITDIKTSNRLTTEALKNMQEIVILLTKGQRQ